MRDASLSASKFQDFQDECAAPKRRGAASPAPARAPKKKRSVLARVFGLQRMGALVLLGIGGLAFVGVPMNALFFQDGRHPAPLFSARATLPAAEPERTETAAAPTPPVRPAQLDAARLDATPAASEPVNPAPAPRAAQKNGVKPEAKPDAAALKAEILKSEAPAARPTKAVAAKAEKKRDVAARDPIGQLIGGGKTHPAPAETANKDVYFAQRALQRLGYVVNANGKLDLSARQVIQNFERDNGLPVKGQINPKLLKLLAARSGLAQE